MTQEQKDLLLKDLCERLPYGVKCAVHDDTNIHSLSGVVYGKPYRELYFEELDWKECDGFEGIQYCKPYLFPISNMNEEQLEEFYCEFVANEINFNDFKKYYFETSSYYELLITVSDCPSVIEWFIKNHFDYRGLIHMGLAIDATNLKIY